MQDVLAEKRNQGEISLVESRLAGWRLDEGASAKLAAPVASGFQQHLPDERPAGRLVANSLSESQGRKVQLSDRRCRNWRMPLRAQALRAGTRLASKAVPISDSSRVLVSSCTHDSRLSQDRFITLNGRKIGPSACKALADAGPYVRAVGAKWQSAGLGRGDRRFGREGQGHPAQSRGLCGGGPDGGGAATVPGSFDLGPHLGRTPAS